MPACLRCSSPMQPPVASAQASTGSFGLVGPTDGCPARVPLGTVASEALSPGLGRLCSACLTEVDTFHLLTQQRYVTGLLHRNTDLPEDRLASLSLAGSATVTGIAQPASPTRLETAASADSQRNEPSAVRRLRRSPEAELSNASEPSSSRPGLVPGAWCPPTGATTSAPGNGDSTEDESLTEPSGFELQARARATATATATGRARARARASRLVNGRALPSLPDQAGGYVDLFCVKSLYYQPAGEGVGFSATRRLDLNSLSGLGNVGCADGHAVDLTGAGAEAADASTMGRRVADGVSSRPPPTGAGYNGRGGRSLLTGGIGDFCCLSLVYGLANADNRVSDALRAN
ncbi:unnamed protein product [Protopolystoma xenopodis]|uniref:Uncharacterized protein n=1 Tax=Protopolystoma xenopodis TaxID=117903 RepID=A0A448WXY3_9PLAT|nr:unnamed protein product [Protopolystoma xenopodis]